MLIRTLGDLIDVLLIYDRALPVRFTSSESGGFWPRGQQEMVIGTDESVREVKRDERWLEISLLLPLSDD